MTDNNLPKEAQVVIIGGGIIGCSVAFHLARLGVQDVVLLERKKLTSGTTWHAAGLVAQLRASQNMTRLAKYSTELFQELESITGQATGYQQTGSITLALNREREAELKRQATMANAFQVDCNWIGPGDIEHHWPGLALHDVLGGVYLAGDGQTNPVDTTLALAKGARQAGALILEDTEVQAIHTTEGQATGVSLSDGRTIQARTVVVATGMWTRDFLAPNGVLAPLQAAEHFYLVTEPLPSFNAMRPTLRIPDEEAYYKFDAGKLLLGAFEREAKPWALDGIPESFAFDGIPADFEHFEPIFNRAIQRFPELEAAGIQLFFNGPESFTPDNRYLLGETPEISQLFVAAGFNSIGIQSAGGVGKVLAEWITSGRPPMDLWDVDIKRAYPFQNDKSFLAERTTEALGLLYDLHWPDRQFETGRNIFLGPLHDRLAAEGAVWGELAGIERPLWFDQTAASTRDYSYGSPEWFESVAAECRAAMEQAVLFDQSSYPIFDITGPQALAFMQWLCANQMDVAIDQLVYTQWLNDQGGIEADVTVLRLNEQHFRVTGGCGTWRRDLVWLQRQAKLFDVTVTHRTDLATLGLMGPKSDAILHGMLGTTPDQAYYTSSTHRLGDDTLRINRLSYIGEHGFELVIQSRALKALYESLMTCGKEHGLRPAGFFAMDSCRMEKGYRHWGDDLHDHITPWSAGLGFCVDLEKTDFLGKSALQATRGTQLERLVNVRVDDPQAPRLIHDEPIFFDGRLVGLTTSAAWGHRLNANLAIASLTYNKGVTKRWLAQPGFTIEVAGEHFPVTLQLAPFYDPKSERTKQ